ncbi:MAG: type IV pilus biogenesis protein PilP [Alphaproteobacteria bacterium]|nr:type IV pilus biogenesis protein PilP [Alphaproteobacteria bacterium]
MQNKIKMLFVSVCVLFGVTSGYCDTVFENVVDVIEEVNSNDIAANEEFSADAIEDYQVDGSLFQQITDLEQEKVLMQLEKERAQLNLDLDRLAAEKIKLHMEIDTLSGRAEQQQQEFETERARLEAEAKRLELEKESMVNKQQEVQNQPLRQQSFVAEAPKDVEIEKNYKLLNVFGAGAQLQATVQDLSNGQNKRLSVGKQLDGYTVKSISLDEGVVFIKDGEIQTLNVGNKN